MLSYEIDANYAAFLYQRAGFNVKAILDAMNTDYTYYEELKKEEI